MNVGSRLRRGPDDAEAYTMFAAMYWPLVVPATVLAYYQPLLRKLLVLGLGVVIGLIVSNYCDIELGAKAQRGRVIWIGIAAAHICIVPALIRWHDGD